MRIYLKKDTYIMKKYKPRIASINKYALMIEEVKGLCNNRQSFDMNNIARKHKLARPAAYALIAIGVIAKCEINGMPIKNTYTWLNPHQWTSRQISEKVLAHVHNVRDAKKRALAMSRNLQTAKHDLITEKKVHAATTVPVNYNTVKLKVFGLTIFEYETKGK